MSQADGPDRLATSKQASALPIRALILPAKLDTSASTVSWLLTSTLLWPPSPSRSRGGSGVCGQASRRWRAIAPANSAAMQ